MKFNFENEIHDIDKTLQKLTNTIRDTICPDVTFFVKYDIDDGKILKITVNEGSNKPYFLKDKGLTPAGVYVRQGSSSAQASYEKPANIFFRLHHIESYGTGLRKIMRLYDGYSVKPKIEVFPNAFVITLPNLNYSYTLKNEIIDEKHKKILEHIKVNKYVTSKDIQKMFDIKRSRAYKIIKDMKDMHLIKNSGKKGYYEAMS